MRCPVMLGSKIDKTSFVTSGVIGAERIYPRLRRGLMEPNAREKTTRRFNPLGSRGRALVGDDLCFKAGSLQLTLV